MPKASKPLLRSVTLSEIQVAVGGTIIGAPSTALTTFAALASAEAGALAFARGDHTESLAKTQASAVIVSSNLGEHAPCPAITHETPDAAFAKAVQLMMLPASGGSIHPSAVVSPRATVSSSARLGPGVIVEDDAVIDDDARLDAGVIVGTGARVGARTHLAVRSTLCRHCDVGSDCYVGEHTAIGVEGFGYYPTREGEWVHLPHVGVVTIEPSVSIGSHVNIARSTMPGTATLIKSGTVVGDLVHVGHNCVIGEQTMIINRSSVAGSCTLGKRVVIAGCSSLGQGVTLGDGVELGASSTVTPYAHIPAGTTLRGAMMAKPRREWARMVSVLRRLARQ